MADPDPDSDVETDADPDPDSHPDHGRDDADGTAVADDTSTGGADTATGPADATTGDDPSLPADVVSRAVTLTRRMRRAVDATERAADRAERDRLLDDHAYVARVRDDDTGATLVLYPAEWVQDGVVQVGSIADTDRAVERSLSGVGADDYEVVETYNRAVADRVAERHGDPHGATAHAFADFMGNHYRKRVGAATPAERREFREEYFPRNAWPTDAQRDAVAESLRLVDEVATEL